MPISSVAMSVEGVLQKYQPTVPIPVGVALYHSLATNFNILLYSEDEKKSLDYWLGIEALTKHAAVEYNEGPKRWEDSHIRKMVQLASLHNRGFHIDLVIDPDPTASVKMIESGYNVMTFTHAQYALPQWRPDYTEQRRPWKDFEDAAIKLAELRALDTRMKDQ